MRYLFAFWWLIPMPLCAATTTVDAIPDRFLGVWAENPGACGSGNDDLRLEISPREVKYWESQGPIKAVVLNGESEMALIVELTDEGETWLATARFILSPDRNMLVDATAVPGQDTIRHRCPATKESAGERR